jgi:hypothetical protein
MAAAASSHINSSALTNDAPAGVSGLSSRQQQAEKASSIVLCASPLGRHQILRLSPWVAAGDPHRESPRMPCIRNITEHGVPRREGHTKHVWRVMANRNNSSIEVQHETAL